MCLKFGYITLIIAHGLSQCPYNVFYFHHSHPCKLLPTIFKPSPVCRLPPPA